MRRGFLCVLKVCVYVFDMFNLRVEGMDHLGRRKCSLEVRRSVFLFERGIQKPPLQSSSIRLW